MGDSVDPWRVPFCDGNSIPILGLGTYSLDKVRRDGWAVREACRFVFPAFCRDHSLWNTLIYSSFTPNTLLTAPRIAGRLLMVEAQRTMRQADPPEDAAGG
eukprot:g42352.t1